MTDQRDGILDPEDSETVDNTPELEAVRLWAGNPTEDSWRAAHDALAPGKDKLDKEVVEGAMHKYAVAGDDKAREKARAELFTLIANRQPIGTTTWGELGKAPPRDWLVTGWLPTGCVSILSGRGGVGKSRLALQLAAGVASGGGKEGEPDVWLEGPPDAANPLLLGTAVSNGGVPVLYVSWEDDDLEFSRRLAAISGDNKAPWVSPERLAQLHFADMAGRGPTWGPGVGVHISTRAELLPAGELLRERAEALDAQLVILDPLAAAWVGNENDRSLVRSFMSDWDAWARQGPRGVLVLAHEPKSRESGPAGSTDWEAASRAVWTLGKERHGPERKLGRYQTDDRPFEWKFDLVKANYGEPEALRMAVDADHDAGRWRVAGPWDDAQPKGGSYDPAS